jgi:hypothetical protein
VRRGHRNNSACKVCENSEKSNQNRGSPRIYAGEQALQACEKSQVTGTASATVEDIKQFRLYSLCENPENLTRTVEAPAFMRGSKAFRPCEKSWKKNRGL